MLEKRIMSKQNFSTKFVFFLDLLGGEQDENGCLGGAGYTWCEAKSKCVRTWEEPCETTTSNLSFRLFI